MLQNIKMLDFTRAAKFIGVCVFASIISFQASAQFAPSPCDPDYYDSLEARAWLEAQREITQNQNLIVKPDSVLEYTCFDGHLAELGDHADEMFSETTRWGTILPSNSMDDALDNLAGNAMNTYIGANFGHTFLGGRSTEDFTAVSGSSYTCDRMLSVWQDAKCTNFGERSHDGFFTLQQYVDDSQDKRLLPMDCGARPSQWEDDMETALGLTSGSATSDPSLTPWEEDPVETYYDRLFPTSGCGTGSSSRVRTGLTVRQTKGTPDTYIEHVCIVPGCYWEPTGTGSGSCQES